MKVVKVTAEQADYPRLLIPAAGIGKHIASEVELSGAGDVLMLEVAEMSEEEYQRQPSTDDAERLVADRHAAGYEEEEEES